MTLPFEPASGYGFGMLLLLVACAAPPPSAWVGPAEDTRLTVGVAVDGDEVRAYACGEGELLTESRWFEGARGEGDAVHLQGDDGWSIELDLAGEAVTGVLGAPWGSYAWTAAAVEAPGGVYLADEDGCATGVLVAGADVHGTWCDAEGSYAQVEPPDTLVPDEDGAIEVGVTTPTGWRALRVYPVFPR